MELYIENIVFSAFVFLLIGSTIYFYFKIQNRKSLKVREKLSKAKKEGLFEPVSLHPYIDLNKCIGSAACVAECPEKDILGVIDGKATVINASNCIGHGACFHNCPVEAISLRIGTEKRGVELPHIKPNFETNIKGIYIAGELGGMGLIKNSVEQGQQAIADIANKERSKKDSVLDVLIVGAGPAGIAASLAARLHRLKFITVEQETLGGTVATFPRDKIVMTAPMNLPLYGRVKLYDTSKAELLSLWQKVLQNNNLTIYEKTKVEQIIPQPDSTFKVVTNTDKIFFTKNVILAIGRRGTPRKLNVPGEDMYKVAYRLLEPEHIKNADILVVGGGDSAIEAALALMENNRVLLSYRKEQFVRLKPKNKEKIMAASENNQISILYNTEVVAINEKDVLIRDKASQTTVSYKNDRVFIFAGGELPTQFLTQTGIEIKKRFAYIVKKHH